MYRRTNKYWPSSSDVPGYIFQEIAEAEKA
jgi:hypothetical protein